MTPGTPRDTCEWQPEPGAKLHRYTIATWKGWPWDDPGDYVSAEEAWVYTGSVNHRVVRMMAESFCSSVAFDVLETKEKIDDEDLVLIEPYSCGQLYSECSTWGAENDAIVEPPAVNACYY